jgi:ferritin-like protein
MDRTTRIGRNRTGVQMSPFDSANMRRRGDEQVVDTTQPRADLHVRQDYVDEADALGSVPIPTTVSGVLQSAGALLAGKRPQVLIDKIGERLAFERGGARLYDSLLVKCRVSSRFGGLRDQDFHSLLVFRDQETEHAAVLARALRDLGADPTAQTPCADLVGVESQGLVQAINDPRTTLLQSLRVMLDAELIDHASWELLIELTRATGHDAIADRFEHALQEESVHLSMLNELVRRLTLLEARVGPRLIAEQRAAAQRPVPGG